jgi:hypothetical protein
MQLGELHPLREPQPHLKAYDNETCPYSALGWPLKVGFHLALGWAGRWLDNVLPTARPYCGPRISDQVLGRHRYVGHVILTVLPLPSLGSLTSFRMQQSWANFP